MNKPRDISKTALRLPRRILRKARRLLEGDSRSLQLHDEVMFWRDWFRTKGLDWPDDYRERLDPDFPLQNHVSRYVDKVRSDVVRILDVGSGPLTKLGKVHASKEIKITATDLLASEYDNLLNEFSVKPLVRTIYGNAEGLAAQFGENKFDIVHGQNCIDHTADPVTAIRQMISVAKPDGFIVLYHAENEGAREAYKQLHKWDFTCVEGKFVIKGPGPNGPSYKATDGLSSAGVVECYLEDSAVLVAIWKTA